MKIAFLLGSLNRGGTETLLLDVFCNAKVNNLNAIGIYRKTGALEVEYVNSGVSVFKLSYNKNLINYIKNLRRILIDKEINLVHAQQPLDALFSHIACRGTKIKTALTLHGYDYNDKGLAKSILSYIIRQTDMNIYVSDTQREYYQAKFKLNPLKQKVVYNGVSFERLNITHQMTLSSNHQMTLSHQLSTSNKIRNELNLSPETILIGTVGNFVSVRDQFTICRFLKRLNDNKIDFHFLFIGKQDKKMPQLYDNCINYCEQNGLSNKVSFLGSRNDVPELLREMDAFIYSTDHDTFGIAVVEAMAVGIPVFVNDWGVMREITEDGKYATLYKTRDEESLLQQFMLFLQNKPAYQAKATEAAKFVREQYSIEKHIEKLKAVYKQLVISDERLVISD
ncbi:MAG TPA: glycosyltransferase family 4 protein [Candidatus Paceibacterota bacterium]